MGAIRSFRELDVYRLARAIADYLSIDKVLSERGDVLADRSNSTIIAVNAMIAEAWARRRYVASFTNKINEALGEAMETQAWLDHAVGCQYIAPERHSELDAKWHHVGAMLNRMIETADDFCKPSAPRLPKK